MQLQAYRFYDTNTCHNWRAGFSGTMTTVGNAMSGSDGHGCSWSGHFALIDDRYSLYEFDTELQSCDSAGHYTGLAWHGFGWDPGEYWLKILAGDGQHALLRNFSNR